MRIDFDFLYPHSEAYVERMELKEECLSGNDSARAVYLAEYGDF